MAAHKQVDLHHAARQRGRGGDIGEALEFWRHARAFQAQRITRAGGGPPDNCHLHKTCERDGQGKGIADAQAERLIKADAQSVAERAAKRGSDDDRKDEDDVQQNRGGGGGHEAARGVQHARQQRCE